MAKARLALIAALALALVGVFLATKPPPTVELHFLTGAQVRDSFTVTFGVSNLTGGPT
jgi:hypothetical protein